MTDSTLLQEIKKECQSLNLLYVEDDLALSKTTQEMLKPFFHSIVVAHDGQEGLKAYQKGNFDMVLTDIIMPRMNGREMCREIKAMNPRQTIIVMSANEDTDYLMELIDIGIHKFIQKPPKLQNLFECILTAAIDINNAKKVAMLAKVTQHDLAESKALLRSIIDTVPVRIFWKDRDSRYLGCNTLFAKDAGYKDQNDLIGKSDFELQWKEYAQGFVDDDKLVMESEREKISYDEQVVCADGNTMWVTTSKTPLKSEHGNIIGVLGAYIDITKQKEAMQAVQKARDELGYQAEHDTLTGLPNRTLYFDRLRQAIKKSSRDGTKTAVIFIDLDRFKEINDSFGHDTGDEVVKLLAKRLRKEIRKVDTLARFGGDEFIVLIESFTDLTSVTEVLQKLIKSMQTPFFINNHALHLTLSAGISIYPDDGDDAELLIRNADTAMYRAKDNGRDSYHFYTKEMTQESYSHIIMSKNIRRALENNELSIYYQPQIDARSNTITGMEALVRWLHPVDGFISPDEFIPVAEDYGLIDKIGEYVFSEATSQIVSWYEKGYAPGRISINLSTVELQQKNLVKRIRHTLKKFNCKPEWVELEITEGYTMKHPDQAINMLQEIKDLGISLSIDDFGTGYSSLSYLKRLPIHKLKIDQSFVRDIPGSSNDEAIIESIISMAHSMKFEVIAEGVETLEQQTFLQEKGCHHIQGYLHARPMPSEEMEQFLASFPIQ